MTKRRVAIIGGGITGLCAARELLLKSREHREELEIVLFESSSRLGGKVITYREDGLTLEGGPDSILARKPAGVRLLHELGLDSEIVETNTAANRTYIVRHGQLETMPSGTFMGIPADVSQFVENKVLTPQGKLRTLFDLLLPKSNLHHDVSLGQFLRARLGDEWVDEFAEPLLAGIYAGDINQLSLDSTWPQFSNLAKQYRSLIIGARSMRQSATPSNHGRSAFITVRAGLFTLIERLADTLADDVEIHLRHRVTDLIRRDKGLYTLAVEHQSESWTTDVNAVIVSTPVPVMKQLLLPYLPARSKSFAVPYASTATVILGYPADNIDVDLANASGFLVPRSEHRAITASTWVSSKWPHAAPSEYVVLRCYVGRMGQTDDLSLDDGELVKVVQRDVRDIVGIFASPVFSKVTRWEHSMPNYPVGHSQQVAALEADIADALPGIYVGGAGYRGIGLPDCIAHGEEMADKVLTYLNLCQA